MPEASNATSPQALPSIVIIDDSKLKQLFLTDVLRSDFTVFAFSSENEAVARLGDIRPQCILTDTERPGEDGFATLRHLKENPQTAGVPVILITSSEDGDTERRALEEGVVDFVGNKFAPAIIRNRVRNQVELYGYRCRLEERVEEKTRGIQELQDAIMMVLSDLVECRDTMTSGHAVRTRSYVERLIRQLQEDGSYAEALTQAMVRDIIRAAPLHDIGKVGIRDAVLNKPGRLTPEEFEDMKRHTVLGAQAIKHAMETVHDNTFLTVLRDITFSHHERWDGTGYPLGLRGATIPLPGRIMAIPDVYDALVSERPYKKPYPHARAVDIIREGVGSHFDPRIGAAFLACEQDFARIAQTQR